MRSCSTESRRHGVSSAWLALAVMLAACSGGRGPAPSELDPLTRRRPPRPVLADEAEQSAANLAALALADDLVSARVELEQLRRGPHTGLADNAEDVLNAARGERAYVQLSEQMLEHDDLDPALRLRLERYLDEQPLQSAKDSLADNRRYRLGSMFNRAVAPLSRLSVGAALNPIETARSTVASIRVLTSFPDVTPWERKALHEWEGYLKEYPDTPEAEELVERVQRYRAKRTAFLHGKAMKAAERAHEARSSAATLAHLDRADRLSPATDRSAELRGLANQRHAARQRALRESWNASALAPTPLDSEASRDFESLSIAVLSAPPARIAELARAWRREQDPGLLADELAFIESLAARLSDEEDRFTHGMLQVARTRDSNMSRHAGALLASLDQNPYGYYESAVRADRRQRRSWVLFGRRSWRPSRDTFPMPVEVLLGLPGRVVAFIVFPIRLIRYPATRSRFGDTVIATGEHYLGRFPQGAHAEEVNQRLESLYAQRGRWLSALERHLARERIDPGRVEKYRHRIAERTLMAAEAQQRIDVQIALLRAIIVEYPETDASKDARDALREAMSRASAQRIRVSRGFLLEFPELWGPAALGLRPELFDGDDDNGELDEDGIFLLGRTYVEISLEGRDPLVRSIPPEQFAHFVALLEEASYHQLATDAREQPQPDPQRDLFFERARLGLLDTADLRPTARSRAEFLSTQEKHGSVRRRNILPVELVLRGDLDHLGLAAFPRIRLPREDPDAFLFK